MLFESTHKKAASLWLTAFLPASGREPTQSGPSLFNYQP